MLLLALFALFLVLILIRVPVAVALGVSALVGIVTSGMGPLNGVTQIYRGLDTFALLAVPFFLTVGFIATAGSVGNRLLQLAMILVGRIRGGLGHVNVVVSMLFAGVSGSATADTAGVGAVLIPMMRQRGYSGEYSAALTGMTSVIGSIIPPSIIFILYGAFAQVSVGALFLAGVVPGTLCGLGYFAYNYRYARKHGVDQGHVTASELKGALTSNPTSGSNTSVQRVGSRPTVRTQLRIGVAAMPALAVPLLILVGITGGFFTATEAGAVALVYLVFISIFVYRDISVRGLATVLRDAVAFYSLPVLAAGAATLFGWVITVLGAQDYVVDFINVFDVSAFWYLVLVVAVFLLIGSFLDAFPAIVIFAPLFLPGATELGVHPVLLGVVVTMTLAVGLVTPPYGLCLLIAARLADVSVTGTIRAIMPLWLLTLGVIFLISLLPDLALGIPQIVFPDLFL